MFKIQPDPTFEADVKLSVPGQKDPATVRIKFHYKGRDESAEFVKTLKKKSYYEACKEIIVSWQDFDVEYSEDNLAKLLANYVPAGNEILMAYCSELAGAREKN